MHAPGFEVCVQQEKLVKMGKRPKNPMRFFFIFNLCLERHYLVYLYSVLFQSVSSWKTDSFFLFIYWNERHIHNQMRVVTPELIFLRLVFCFLYFKACESFVKRTLVFILLAWARDLFLRGFAV